MRQIAKWTIASRCTRAGRNSEFRGFWRSELRIPIFEFQKANLEFHPALVCILRLKRKKETRPFYFISNYRLSTMCFVAYKRFFPFIDVFRLFHRSSDSTKTICCLFIIFSFGFFTCVSVGYILTSRLHFYFTSQRRLEIERRASKIS